MKHSFEGIVVLFFLTTLSCATASNRAEEKEVAFAQVQNLQIGRTTKDEVRALFGEGLLQLASDREQRLVWLYFLKPPGYQRMNLGFDSKSGILQSIAWFVDSREPEGGLEIAKSHFPNANFVGHTTYRQVADAIQTVGSYDDEKLGVSIHLGSNLLEVNSITFNRPSLIRKYNDESRSKPKVSDYKVLVDNYHRPSPETAQSIK